MSQPSMLSVHLIEPPVANSGVAGGACVIAVAAPATMNDPKAKGSRSVRRKAKEGGREGREETDLGYAKRTLYTYIYIY